MAPSVVMENLDQYFADFHPHMCIYSFNGVGKTYFSGMTGLRTVLLDCGDAGAMTLKRQNIAKLKVVRIKSIMHYLDVMDAVHRKADQIDLLVIDTLTGLQSKAIREVKGKRQFEMSQRKWGQVTSRVVECIAETRSFPHDVIYLAQERNKRSGEDGPTHISPSLTPGIREYMSGNVDWVGHMYLEDNKRKLSFILTDEVEAKDRSDLFPKVIGKPSYMPIRNRIVENIHG